MLKSTAAQENLSYVMGAELQRLPVSKADKAFAKLQAGKPKLVVTGEVVCVLFSDGTPFVTCSIHELLRPPPNVEYHDGQVTLG
jgi:hypothetical protein